MTVGTRASEKVLFCGIFITSFFISPSVSAQRLVLEINESLENSPRVLYGQYLEGKLWLFETEYALTRTDQIHASQPVDQERTAAKNDKALAATFAFGKDDLQKCSKTKRFESFLKVVNTFGKQVYSLAVHSSAKGKFCADEVAFELEKTGRVIERSNIESAESVSISMFLSVVPKESLASQKIESKPESKVGNPVLTVAGSTLAIQSDGYFIAVFATSEPVIVRFTTPEYDQLVLSINPIAVGPQVTKILGSVFYSERQAHFSQKAMKASLQPIPHLDSKLSFDMGVGGGYGYGVEIPGEVRGKRYYSQMGIERKSIAGPLGANLNFAYSYAKDSVIPFTLSTRFFGFYDYSVLQNRLSATTGLGIEHFKTRLKAHDGSNSTGMAADQALIPEEVLAPLFQVGVKGLFVDCISVGANLFATPIYVPDSGFYPSYSPKFELGYKFGKNWIVAIATGSETHRYPSLQGDTKLQIDFSLLTVKTGLF